MRCWNRQVPLAKVGEEKLFTTAKEVKPVEFWQTWSLGRLLWDCRVLLAKDNGSKNLSSQCSLVETQCTALLRTENTTAGLQVCSQHSEQWSPRFSFQRASLGFPKSHGGCLGPRWEESTVLNSVDTEKLKAGKYWAVVVFTKSRENGKLANAHSKRVAFRSTHGQTMVDQRWLYLSLK